MKMTLNLTTEFSILGQKKGKCKNFPFLESVKRKSDLKMETITDQDH